jgi:hypothetical protein
MLVDGVGADCGVSLQAGRSDRSGVDRAVASRSWEVRSAFPRHLGVVLGPRERLRGVREDGRLRPPAADAGGERSEPPLMS